VAAGGGSSPFLFCFSVFLLLSVFVFLFFFLLFSSVVLISPPFVCFFLFCFFSFSFFIFLFFVSLFHVCFFLFFCSLLLFVFFFVFPSPPPFSLFFFIFFLFLPLFSPVFSFFVFLFCFVFPSLSISCLLVVLSSPLPLLFPRSLHPLVFIRGKGKESHPTMSSHAEWVGLLGSHPQGLSPLFFNMVVGHGCGLCRVLSI